MVKLMEFMSVDAVRMGLKETQTILFPIGVVEQHGYHLPLTTDTIIAYGLAKEIAKNINCFVAPPMNYNFSGGTLPGTINVSPQVVSLVIMEICSSLTLQGFKNIVVILGHGGTESLYGVQLGLDMFQRKNLHLKDVQIALIKAWEFSEIQKQAFKEKDFHAGFIETSLILYFAPNLVKEQKTVDSKEIMEMFRKDQDSYQIKEKLVDDENIIPRIYQNPKIKVGVMGEPNKGSLELGKKIVQESVNNIIKLIKKMETF